ncbi:MAG: SPFH domain-containing protein [Albidovulum sp.]|nr:SPFH domain-containing protein [Albidovulum sp.]MDE0305754.1 SPFH domain-containing protein [Albidovulum sp.]MDE0533823.1 SPFH domain-containing protein [Albidovulum sp.]
MSAFWTVLVAAVVAAVIIIVVLAKLYRKASREVSLIRTGVGGQKVIMAGGAISLPYFHEVSEVNMRTLRLEVKRSGEDSLITRDRLRIDIGASFSVAVDGTEDAVSRAAQTLGHRTFEAERLREIVEGKMVDALRAVAAQMTMDEAHEGRAEFSSRVRSLIAGDLAENGLRLQSVSLTSLDQTPFRSLDENNAFNAVGMRKLAEVIAKSKKERAQIDSDAEVAVRLASMEATRKKLEIDRDEEKARIAQEQEIATLRAAQTAEIAFRRAESEKEAEAARIEKEQAVSQAQVARDKSVRSAEIGRDLEIEASVIAKEQNLQIKQKDSAIAIAEKSEMESQANALADRARAEAATAAEAIITARRVAEADREKRLALIEAEKSAESDKVRLTTLAAAERNAAVDHAAAKLEAARAEADAERERAEAKKASLLAEAEGRKALHEAENALDETHVSLKKELARIETIPRAIAEMVKPAERIESIKVHNITGLGAVSGGVEGGGEKTPVNHALDSILGMAVQLPALRQLGDELGLSMGEGMKQVTDRATPVGKGDSAKN